MVKQKKPVHRVQRQKAKGTSYNDYYMDMIFKLPRISRTQ